MFNQQKKIIFILVVFPQIILSIYPVAVFHGLGDACLNLNHGFSKELSKMLNGSYVSCVQSGESVLSILGESFISQAEKACENLKKDQNFLNQNISVLGLSQGALIARYIAQNCEFGGQVKRLISIGGPQMGVSMIPQCSFNSYICRIFNDLIGKGVYTSLAQKSVGPAGYFRDQYNLKDFEKYSTFLKDLNTEKNGNFNNKQKMLNLEKLTLIMFDQDTMIIPKETAWFQSYKENSVELQTLQETEFYQNDTLGLKTLDSQQKIHRIIFNGNHLQFGEEEILLHIIPALI